MEGDAEIWKSVCDFTIDVYRKAIELQNGTKNTFLSPFSIWMAAAMTMAGSEGETGKEMVMTLRMPENMDGEKLHQCIQCTTQKCLQSEEDAEVSLANRLFVLRQAQMAENFVRILKQYYGSATENLAFLKSCDEKRVYINKWVCKETKDKIKELLPPTSITSDSILTIVNTLYFRGTWMNVFHKHQTKADTFHKLDGSTMEVQMMSDLGYYDILQLPTLEARAIKLRFRSPKWQFLIILPNKTDGLPKLLSTLSGTENLNSILSKQFENQHVDLKLPKFKLGEGPATDAKTILTALGMKRIFDLERAELAGICTNQKFFVSDVIHKAVLEVDENGVIAAAATAMMLCGACGMMAEPVEFRVDHPFVVAIIYDDKVPLFLGHIVQP
ncbi:unnamed protein product [Calicophoron daubneyi]|uniref:Serpin domain-containing protein n=1 Tax=Calicophoron daubneyi TaxID=300641 RepID=A0AAV2TPH7_CALDB